MSRSAKEKAAKDAIDAAERLPPPSPPKPPSSVLEDLHDAVICGRAADVAQLLTRSNANYADPKHQLTLLMWGVEANELAVAEALLRRGAVQHLSDPGGFTALHRAAHRKSEAMVRLLLRFDASAENVNAASAASRRTPLILGAMQGSVGVVRALLATGVARVDARDSAGMSGIDHAAFRGFEEIVTLLAAHGASCGAALYFAGDGAKHALTRDQQEQYDGLVKLLYSPWAEQSVVTA